MENEVNKGGRPPVFETAAELQTACESYFTQEGLIKPTVTGLALFLGFADKSSLYEYRDKPGFSYPVKRSLTRIEQYHEEGLSENNVAGRIFALKNMGWKDKVETGFTDTEGKDVQPQIIFQPAPHCKPVTSEEEEAKS